MVQRITSILMLAALCFAVVGALTEASRAQSSFREEIEKTGIVPSMVIQNSRTIDSHERDISELRRRADYLDNLHVETRIAMLEDYVRTAKENQKLLYGMLIALVVFGLKEIYIGFFKPRPPQQHLIS